ncbi:Bug family tripartite tricarboxylate transporter substrate binding protein [Siccirubricoccus deserti]
MQRRALLAGMASIPLARPAIAQSYPDRPLTMVIAFPAGGGTDIAARPLARIMEKYLGQPVVITNRPGAAGEIGFTELARSKPDGYTIGFINTPTIVTIPIERPQARFRLDDFSPVLNIVDDPGAIWVVPDSPIRNVADLVAEAKKRPGQVSYGTSGIGSDDHLAVLALERVTGTNSCTCPSPAALRCAPRPSPSRSTSPSPTSARRSAISARGCSARSARWARRAGR